MDDIHCTPEAMESSIFSKINITWKKISSEKLRIASLGNGEGNNFVEAAVFRIVFQDPNSKMLNCISYHVTR